MKKIDLLTNKKKIFLLIFFFKSFWIGFQDWLWGSSCWSAAVWQFWRCRWPFRFIWSNSGVRRPRRPFKRCRRRIVSNKPIHQLPLSMIWIVIRRRIPSPWPTSIQSDSVPILISYKNRLSFKNRPLSISLEWSKSCLLNRWRNRSLKKNSMNKLTISSRFDWIQLTRVLIFFNRATAENENYHRWSIGRIDSVFFSVFFRYCCLFWRKNNCPIVLSIWIVTF